MFLQIIFWIAVIFVIFFGLILRSCGRQLASINNSLEVRHSHRRKIQRQHFYLARLFLVSVSFVLILAEISVRINELIVRDWLFFTHLALAIPGFVGLLAIHWKFNGIRHNKIHRYLAHGVLIFILGAVITGIPLFLRIGK